MISLFLKTSYCSIFTLLVVIWDDKMPTWWDKVNEWHNHGDVELGDYWPSDSTSNGESSALGNLGLLSHDNVDGWLSGAENVDTWGCQVGWSRKAHGFIMLLLMTHNLKHALVISGIFNFIFWGHDWSLWPKPWKGQPWIRVTFWYLVTKTQSGLTFPSPGDLLGPEIEAVSSALAGRFFITELVDYCIMIKKNNNIWPLYLFLPQELGKYLEFAEQQACFCYANEMTLGGGPLDSLWGIVGD